MLELCLTPNFLTWIIWMPFERYVGWYLCRIQAQILEHLTEKFSSSSSFFLKNSLSWFQPNSSPLSPQTTLIPQSVLGFKFSGKLPTSYSLGFLIGFWSWHHPFFFLIDFLSNELDFLDFILKASLPNPSLVIIQCPVLSSAPGGVSVLKWGWCAV